MSEFIDMNVRDVASYQQFVSRFRNKNLGEDWKINSSEYLSGEVVEALTQHGGIEAIKLFMPGYNAEDVSSDTKFAVADEFGDILWFTVDCLDRSGIGVTQAYTLALESFGATVGYGRTFNDIQQAAVEAEDRIRYVNKAGLVMGYSSPESAPEHFVATLPQNPLFHLTRTSRRLTRALEGGVMDEAPYASSAEFEPVADIALAAGQHLLTLAWVTERRLGVSLNGIALFNRDKLAHREAHGKKNDIHFDEAYVGI